MQRLFYIILLFISAAATAFAAKITVVPPSRVTAGEKFVVTIQVDGEVDNAPTPPNIAGCKFIICSSIVKSHRTHRVNGRMVRVALSEFAYTYRADRDGEVTIPSFSIRVNGELKVTKPVSFTILPRGSSSSSRNQPVSIDDPTTMTPDRNVSTDDVFVRIILDKSEAYEHEAIECTIKLYTKYNIEKFIPTKQPSFDGFLIEDLSQQPSLNKREEYNGNLYATAILKECIIFPQKPGTLSISSGDYDLSITQYEQVNMGYITVSNPVTKEIKFSSNTATINIKPLPKPAPEGFTGAVGTNFSVDARLIGNKFSTGEAASLIYEVKGLGNIKFISQPDIAFPSEMELYSPKSDFNGYVTSGSMTGTNTFDYTFVPQAVGDYTITVPPFSYFNPENAEYITLDGKTISIKVAKGTETERQVPASDITDILPIKEGIQNPSVPELAAHKTFYWCLYIVLAILLTVVFFVYRRNLRLNADVTGRRMSRAEKVARGRLKIAKQALDKADNDTFYAEILNAMLGYISDKLAMPASKLSRDNMKEELSAFGAPDELVDKIIDIIDRAEMARYTPSTPEQSQTIYTDTASAIQELEKIKRRK